MLTKRDLLRSAALLQSRPNGKIHSGACTAERRPPRFFKAKDIAEAGFIYGLPIVMNYARHVRVRRGSQFGAVQGAVQSDQERAQRLHLQRHSDPHAEQRHAIFVRLDGLAGGADRPIGPGGGSEALLLGHALRWQYLQLRLYRQPCHRKRSRRLHGGRAGLEGRDPARDQEGVPVEHTVFAGGISHPAFQPGRPRQRQEGPGRLQGADAFWLSEAAGAAAAPSHRLSENRQGAREDELLRIPRLRAAVCARRRRTRRKYAPSLRASASGRARPSASRTSRWSTSWRSAWA